MEQQRGAGVDATARPPTPRELARRARLRWLHGDRPYALLLGGATVVAVLVVSGPVQTWLAQRDLVDQREGVLAALEEENDRLSQRVEDLHDPDTIIAEAREDGGWVVPGEVPYVLIPPAPERERIAADLTDVAVDERGWLARAWEAVTDLFG